MTEFDFPKCRMCGGAGLAISSVAFSQERGVEYGPKLSCPNCLGSGYEGGWPAHRAMETKVECERLRVAGDALAEACAVLLEDAAESAERETTGMKRAYPVLAGWAAARGGSGGEGGAEAAQRKGDDR